ncbi:Uncharacterised protein [Mycobacteroides abscessus subsp. abscessus]|nr:Uncharacterised protein [Mycobacteroides abscessus subsp. abscessus]
MRGYECCGEVLVRHVAGRDDDVRRSGARKFFGDNGEPFGITRRDGQPVPLRSQACCDAEPDSLGGAGDQC